MCIRDRRSARPSTSARATRARSSATPGSTRWRRGPPRTRRARAARSTTARRPRSPTRRAAPRGTQIFDPTSICAYSDTRMSTVLRELDESNRKTSRIDVELTERENFKVRSGRPKPAVDFHAGGSRGAARTSTSSARPGPTPRGRSTSTPRRRRRGGARGAPWGRRGAARGPASAARSRRWARASSRRSRRSSSSIKARAHSWGEGLRRSATRTLGVMTSFMTSSSVAL